MENNKERKQRILKADVDQNNTFLWLRSSDLKPDTEGFLQAAQDQSLNTKNYVKNSMKVNTSDDFRICNDKPETIDHLVAGCSELAKSEYLNRHNKIAKFIHWNLRKFYDLKAGMNW